MNPRDENATIKGEFIQLICDELRHTLRVDPKNLYGEDFPGETFRVLKEKKIKQYREYGTRRLVLEKWDEMFGAK